MTGRILVAKDLNIRISEIEKVLKEGGFKKNHPDLLYFEDESKLGVLEVKKILEFLSLKPYQAKGRVIVLESAHKLTIDAQNALLKTLEEAPINSQILLGAESENSFLPTVLSRTEIVILSDSEGSLSNLSSSNKLRDSSSSTTRPSLGGQNDNHTKQIEDLMKLSIEERFDFIEGLEDKEEFFKALVGFAHQSIKDDPKFLEFAKVVLQAEAWNKSHVNHRAVLEYLMFILPSK